MEAGVKHICSPNCALCISSCEPWKWPLRATEGRREGDRGSEAETQREGGRELKSGTEDQELCKSSHPVSFRYIETVWSLQCELYWESWISVLLVKRPKKVRKELKMKRKGKKKSMGGGQQAVWGPASGGKGCWGSISDPEEKLLTPLKWPHIDGKYNAGIEPGRFWSE